ncbi:MAG: hypothetical protein CMJ08_02610 [Pelagibacterales bacterium]|nr:hypothetical protein [Pelagibacterales bacterium]|tara:strand:+ start:10882 stop:11754 length:873 start_codon:yes stop_codon:yes gene_type:complete
MIQKISIKLLILFTSIFFLSSCSDKFYSPKIERGVFSDIEKKYNKSKKIKIITGDTLKSISKKYNISINEIIRFNKLKPPFVLKPGKSIFLPNYQKYKIKKGDTLFKIAECSLVTVEDLKQRNKNLNAKKLIIGKIIKIPYFADTKNCKKGFKRTKKKQPKKVIVKKIFRWPTSGKVIATFGIKNSGRRNDGINIKAPEGSPVRAAKTGKVIYRGNELPAWGNLILVKHNNGWTTAYAHLEKFFVNVGSELKTGDILGAVGKTGNVDEYQLHFQVRKNSKPLDPLKFLYD